MEVADTRILAAHSAGAAIPQIAAAELGCSRSLVLAVRRYYREE